MCKNQAAPTNVLGRLFSILEIYLFIASETSMLKKPHQMGVAFCFLVRSNATPYVSLNLSPVTS